MTTDLDELVTAGEAAEMAGIHRKTFSAYRSRGQQDIPDPVLVAGRPFYRRGEIEAWAASRGQG